MKIQTGIVGIAALMFVAGPALAQSSSVSESYDSQVEKVSFFNKGCSTCGEPACESCSTCDSCGCDDGGGGGFTINSLLGLDCTPFTVGGWTQIGYHSDAVPLAVGFDSGLAFNDLPGRVNLHQQWLYFEKAVDGSKGFDIGGRFDIMYGTDAAKTQAFGNPGAGVRGAGSWDASLDHGYYGWALPQLYGEVAMGDVSVKFGHFFTLVGYEVVTAPDNFFYSHALTMFNSEPFTHTGVIATYSGIENVTLYGGWTLGWDTGFDQANQGSSFLGGFSLSLLENVTLTYISTAGNFGAISAGGTDYGHSIVVDVTLTEKLNYVFQTDYKGIGGNSTDEDYGVNQYLFYDLNDMFKLGTRMEWWQNDGVDNYSWTGGVNVRLLDNLVFRPEYRHTFGDVFDTGSFGIDGILTY